MNRQQRVEEYERRLQAYRDEATEQEGQIRKLITENDELKVALRQCVEALKTWNECDLDSDDLSAEYHKAVAALAAATKVLGEERSAK